MSRFEVEGASPIRKVEFREINPLRKSGQNDNSMSMLRRHSVIRRRCRKMHSAVFLVWMVRFCGRNEKMRARKKEREEFSARCVMDFFGT